MTTAIVKGYPPYGVENGSINKAAARFDNAMAIYALNKIYATATLATATVTSKVQTTATCTFTLGGAWQTAVSATDNLFVLGSATSGTAVAASSFQRYLLLWDSTGASGTSVYEGTQNKVSIATVAWTNINNVSPWGSLITLLNAGNVIVGAVNVATDATHTFTPGTTLFGAAGITTTYTDGLPLSLLPLLGDLGGNIYGSAV